MSSTRAEPSVTAPGEAAARQAPLAILIPTYSRAGYLERLLRALAADPAILAHRIPVLVADNDSADQTVATVRALIGEFPDLDLRLHQHPRNIGPEANMEWLVKHAPPADYVWLLGDDDMPTEGIVGDVLGVAQQSGPALIHLPCRWETEDGTVTASSACPDTLETYLGSRELLHTYYCLHFVSATVVKHLALLEALDLAPTENDWAPHIWFGVAGRRGCCVVLPRVGVVGGLDSGWLSRRVTLLTRGIVESFDDGFRLVVDHAGFARMLDLRFESAQGNDENWMQAPLEDLLAAVTRFPASRELRRLLVARGMHEGNAAAIAVAADAARRSGAAERAAAHIAEGEAGYARGDLGRAVAELKSALAEDGTSARAWCNLGVVHHAAGNEEAGDAFDGALSVDPENVDALLNRSVWLATCGRDADAASDAERLAEIAPADPRLAQALAVIAMLRGDPRLAQSVSE